MLIVCNIYCDNILLPLSKLSVVQRSSSRAFSHFQDGMKAALAVVYAGDCGEIS